nr:MAG TPA: hypothetical protein [Caudoviricetes sp.]
MSRARNSSMIENFMSFSLPVRLIEHLRSRIIRI